MPDLIEAFTSQVGYSEHLLPILDALPPERRGQLYGTRDVVRELQRYGIPCAEGYGTSPSTAPLLCGGYQDLRYGHRPKLLVQHGAAQQYFNATRYGAYVGGPGHDAADGFLCPNERSAAIEHARYGKPAFAVGSPKLDGWLKIPNPRNGVVGVTFHWPAFLRDDDDQPIPEAGTCFPEWREAITELARLRPIKGHAHPRFAREMAQFWASIGVEFVPRAVDLLVQCETLVLDNSSLGAEWAALDRPTVWLRGEGWLDTHGPPRFDGLVPGPEISASFGSIVCTGDDLAGVIDRASADEWAPRRARFTERTYGRVDGRASERAADAVLALTDGKEMA